MIGRVVLAVVAGVVAFLACVLLGGLLVDLRVSVAATVGEFLRSWAAVIAVLVALWWYFSGRTYVR